MDQTDDFEMKPLTSGLGFQKRQVSLKEQVAKAGLAQQNLRRSLPPEPPAEFLNETPARSSNEIINELHAALRPTSKSTELSKLELTEILPRDIDDIKNPILPPTPDTALNNINFQIPDKTITNAVGPKKSSSDNMIRPLVPVAVSFPSILLDSAVVLAVTLVFLLSLLIVTGVDLYAVFRTSQHEFSMQLSLVVLYLSVLEMYVIVSRSFFGKTLAEWTFDLQMGDSKQIEKASYPLKVLWRSLLNLVTGIIFLPIISFLTGKDLAAKFTGLQLYRKNS